MAPATPATPAEPEHVGPHPSYIEVAKPYMLQSAIQQCLDSTGLTEEKDSIARLQGVTWIDSVRRSLQLPVRTFDTAVVYYHKFRLLHGSLDRDFQEAAAAALFTACKLEDTLKKSREILCAAANLGRPSSEHAAPDDPRFDKVSKDILGLERLMLESAGFDFRNRYPQNLMVKLAKAVGMRKDHEAKTAWNLGIDMYRTFAPLKQTTPTMAVACIELAARLHDWDVAKIVDAGVMAYKKWNTSRTEVMETLLDMLDLYTHSRGSTTVGPLFTIDTFLAIRIALNQEATAANLPRYTLYAHEPAKAQGNGAPNKLRNGLHPTSPLTPATPGTISPSQAPTSAIGIRGQNGTVRFMLDAARAQNEMREYERYTKAEEEEYEVEVPLEPPAERRRVR
ncbi:cyclin-like protein [Lophiotrema nucula]|uniref:RNA polymerase II holoenzyme cyclin-like subunit n=1 Tax=Lophiotrema nucula TaxID=690887 RepID=A0A6A5YUJ3_9PLEO|nr:cyclin-like protein [Lophiotrema nucula]